MIHPSSNHDNNPVSAASSSASPTDSIPSTGMANRFFVSFPSTVTGKLRAYRVLILLLTYFIYMSYFISRKPLSIIKTELVKCQEVQGMEHKICKSFISEIDGMDEQRAKTLLGMLDTVFLFTYAFSMFISGYVAERMDLRYFLSSGMVLAGILGGASGLAYYWNVHSIAWFVIFQMLSAAAQSTGWPAVITIVANWFGRGKKGLFFGIWYSHISVGNIVGSLLAGSFVESSWGLSFIVPGILTTTAGLVVFFVLVPHPDNLRLVASKSGREDHHVNCAVIPNITGGPEVHFHFHKTKPAGKEAVTDRPITLLEALKIPGVVESALCLLFALVVRYIFLYWLPNFVLETGHAKTPKMAAYMSTLFDVGGILGAMTAGLAADLTGKSAITCASLLLLSIPAMVGYNFVESDDEAGNIAILLVLGLLVSGPSFLITTAIATDLGTKIQNGKAMATVGSIINGTGAMGAAVGPLLAGAIPNVRNVFYVLIGSDLLAVLFLSRMIKREVKEVMENRKSKTLDGSKP